MKYKELIRTIVRQLIKQIPLFIGLSIIWYAYNVTTEEQRQKIWFAIKNAHYEWLILSMVLGMLSHWWRAARWEIMLNTLGYKTSQKHRFPATLIGYLSNFGVPRSGEILRGAILARREKIKFERVFGTIIAERMLDFIILIALLLITIIINVDLVIELLPNQLNINYLPLIVTALLLYICFRWLIKKRPRYYFKFRIFIRSLLRALKSTLKIQRKGWFFFYTAMIWIAYVAMVWIPCYSLDDIGYLPMDIALQVFVAGSLAITFTNGGIGAFPLAVALVLSYSGISEVYGEAFGWLVWTAQTLMIIVGGTLSFLYLKFKQT